MSLSDLASLGSFVSGLAVLVSLVFLYFQLRQVTEQVRQAERNQRATIAQVRASRTVEVMLSGCDASMADAFTKAGNGEADLTFTQMQQYTFWGRAMFTNAQDAFNQHRYGLMEDADYRAFLAAFGDNMARPAVRSVWRMGACRVASPEFSDFVEELIGKIPVRLSPSSADMLAAWKASFAELSATATPAVP